MFSKGSLKFWFGLIVSLVFLFLTLRGQDFGAIWRALSAANYALLIPALAAYFAGVWLRAVRWKFLLGPLTTASSRRLFPVVVIGYMANDVLPVRMGEVVRAYVLDKREGVRKTASLATIVVERIFDGLTMLLFIAVASFFVDLNTGIRNIEQIAAAVFVGFILLFFVLASSGTLLRRLEAFGLRFVPGALRPKIEGMADNFITGLQVLRRASDLVAVVGLSLLAWLCEAGMYWLIALAFANLNLSWYAILLLVGAANLATLVPSSPGYVGTFDAAAKLVLVNLFAIETNIAIGYVALVHAALIFPVVALGLIYWAREHMSFKEVNHMRDDVQHEVAAEHDAPHIPTRPAVANATARRS